MTTTTTESSALTPQQRLANSRQALIRNMAPHPDHQAHDDGLGGETAQIDTSAGTWSLLRQVSSAWWRGHPAHTALDVARPMLQSYAENKPFRLLGIAAGLGAAAVLVRPWRLMSLTGLLLTTLKSSEMSGVMRSLLHRGSRQDHRP